MVVGFDTFTAFAWAAACCQAVQGRIKPSAVSHVPVPCSVRLEVTNDELAKELQSSEEALQESNPDSPLFAMLHALRQGRLSWEMPQLLRVCANTSSGSRCCLSLRPGWHETVSQ